MPKTYIIEIKVNDTYYSNSPDHSTEGTKLFGISEGSLLLESILCEDQLS